jgi:hypothetical protein
MGIPTALRRAGAIIAGLLVVVLLSSATDAVMHATRIFPAPGQPMPDGLWVLAAAYRLCYTVAAGFVCARLAPDRPMGHAIVLGLLGTCAAAIGLIVTWDMGPGFGPKWYPIMLTITALPCCWLGAKPAVSS